MQDAPLKAILYLRAADHPDLREIRSLLMRCLTCKLVIVGDSRRDEGELFEALKARGDDVELLPVDAEIPAGAVVIPPVDQLQGYAKSLLSE